MNAYLYKASLYCEDCGKDTINDLYAKGTVPDDPEDERSYDSDDFPKGPYANGGGESDYEQYCEHCGKPLYNPLTLWGCVNRI